MRKSMAETWMFEIDQSEVVVCAQIIVSLLVEVLVCVRNVCVESVGVSRNSARLEVFDILGEKEMGEDLILDLDGR
jgi:hypothetical protein